MHNPVLGNRSRRSSGNVHWWRVDLSNEVIIGRVKITIGVRACTSIYLLRIKSFPSLAGTGH